MSTQEDTNVNRGHLNALELRRSHEIGYRAKARTDTERELRDVWIRQIEREIADEREYLGLEPEDHDEMQEMSDDELLAELDAFEELSAGPSGP